MTLSTGAKLSHYVISSQIGKGGMGVVYQAKDQKLGRDVAIKVLPQEFAQDTDRVARFQREAKLLASLNHPNIAAIYGLEEADGIHFLVLELVEGQTLADRIKAGPIPIEESLKLALQISEALEAAHEKGVIHRDLKPANIKVTPDGRVKVLDFGLAKAYAGEQDQMNLSNSPTLSVAATQQGVILGTAAYMSPEQARGKEVDKRADIWAFGVVLFEMLTGKPLFSGEDVSSTLARVLEREPDFSTLPANLHPKIIEMLERCLEKDPKNRYSGISDARIDIQKVLADPSGVLVKSITAEAPQNKLRTILPWVAITAILCLIITGVTVWILKPTTGIKTITRFPLNVPRGDIISPGDGGVAISPDGSRFVYAAVRNGLRQLYLRNRNQINPVPILNTENGTHPFFSSDGEWIGFFTESELKKVSISGGPAQHLLSTTVRRGATWGPDNTIVFASDDFSGLMIVSSSGGEPHPLTSPEQGERHFWPEFLPNSKAVLFTIARGGSVILNGKVAVLSLETGECHSLVDGTDAHYASSGHLVFGREASLWAAPFDVQHLKVTGDSVPVAENVQVNSGGWAHYDLGNDGSLIYMSGTSSAPTLNLTWVNREGKEKLIASPPGNYRDPMISPDGKQIALVNIDSENNSDIWIWDVIRETLSPLTFNAATDFDPIWTPDGQRISFGSDRDGTYGIYAITSDGSGDAEPLCIGAEEYISPASWSADGSTLVVIDGASESNIRSVLMEGDHELNPLLETDYAETQPRISPNGKWMAYMSNESSQFEIYLRSFPNMNNRMQVSTSGGREPRWSSNGQELFYRKGDTIMVVSVRTEPTLRVEKPEELFRGAYDFVRYDNDSFWDIHPDGNRFLMMKPAEIYDDESAIEPWSKINIVLNWDEELKDKVPVD